MKSWTETPNYDDVASATLDSIFLNVLYAVHVLGWSEKLKWPLDETGDEYWDIIDPTGKVVNCTRYGMDCILELKRVDKCDTEEKRAELLEKIKSKIR